MPRSGQRAHAFLRGQHRDCVGVSANFENVAIDAGDQAEYALTYTDGASGTLTGVTVSGGTGPTCWWTAPM